MACVSWTLTRSPVKRSKSSRFLSTRSIPGDETSRVYDPLRRGSPVERLGDPFVGVGDGIDVDAALTVEVHANGLMLADRP